MNYLFLDLETCGLDDYSPILEIACVITTEDFRTVVKFERVLWGDLSKLNDYTRQMHSKNGLASEVVSEGIGWGDMIYDLNQWLEMADDVLDFKTNGLQLAGNSVFQDRVWLKTTDPTCAIFDHLTTHRLFDVSCLRDFTSQFAAGIDTKKEGGHRAMSDLVVCIEQARIIYEIFQNKLACNG